MYTYIDKFHFHTVSGLIGIVHGDLDLIVQFVPIKIYDYTYVNITWPIVGIDDIG
jgi:hypothetical protein